MGNINDCCTVRGQEQKQDIEYEKLEEEIRRRRLIMQKSRKSTKSSSFGGGTLGNKKTRIQDLNETMYILTKEEDRFELGDLQHMNYSEDHNLEQSSYTINSIQKSSIDSNKINSEKIKQLKESFNSVNIKTLLTSQEFTKLDLTERHKCSFKQPDILKTNLDFVEKALQEIDNIETEQIICGNKDEHVFSDQLIQILNSELVSIDSLNQLQEIEHGCFMMFKGFEYEDSQLQTKRVPLLFYLKQQSNNMITGIQVPLKNGNEQEVKPYLFKYVKGIRLQNKFYFESGMETSLVKQGFVGDFGFKNGCQTMGGRSIEAQIDQEGAYINLIQVEN